MKVVAVALDADALTSILNWPTPWMADLSLHSMGVNWLCRLQYWPMPRLTVYTAPLVSCLAVTYLALICRVGVVGGGGGVGVGVGVCVGVVCVLVGWWVMWAWWVGRVRAWWPGGVMRWRARRSAGRVCRAGMQ